MTHNYERSIFKKRQGKIKKYLMPPSFLNVRLDDKSTPKNDKRKVFVTGFQIDTMDFSFLCEGSLKTIYAVTEL